MSDSSVERVIRHYETANNENPNRASSELDRKHSAEWAVRYVEAAGLIVIDPDDPEVLKRVTLSLYPAFISHPGFADHAARAGLSALKASG
jgi:uncharacterized Ntn-hydrolase superfamily protein